MLRTEVKKFKKKKDNRTWQKNTQMQTKNTIKSAPKKNALSALVWYMTKCASIGKRKCKRKYKNVSIKTQVQNASIKTQVQKRKCMSFYLGILLT
jgi:hypothetical protein